MSYFLILSYLHEYKKWIFNRTKSAMECKVNTITKQISSKVWKLYTTINTVFYAWILSQAVPHLHPSSQTKKTMSLFCARQLISNPSGGVQSHGVHVLYTFCILVVPLPLHCVIHFWAIHHPAKLTISSLAEQGF